MKKISFLFAAMMFAALGSGVLPVTTGTAYADEAADKAELAKKMVVRKEMGKPLTEIQELLDKKQFAEANEKINALDNMENKTPYEVFALSRMRAVVASGTNNTPLLAASFDKMINSEFLKDNEKLRLIEGLAGTYYNEKNYAEAIVWAKRYIEKSNANPQMNNLLARCYYLKGDFQNAIAQLKTMLADDEKAQRITTEENLRLLASSYQQLKDNAGYTAVLERVVQHYPTREYWGDLIYRVEHKPGFSDRLRLDLYRLLLATNNMDDAAQYVEMAELALLAGLPSEAKTAVDAGYAANLLGAGKEATKHKQLKDRVYKQAAEDIKSLDAGETAAKNAKTGTGLVNIGYNYVINNQAEKGINLMEQGIAKGGLKSADEARLHLGMAYLQSGNRDKAAEIFKSLQAADGTADLGRLWLYVRKAETK
ncbi:tetratricopeptide repeat protein [Undibacterium griseum]|uniref:Tetratricopeptide repeat protein n=1 Tax=Undibacterium griseum TaxID=2762295 RepID=A0ABR6YIM1_9BURK|nr:tetratricopeptide repeat protein [Undibacterium griseum]MBC3883751.1 tetratricopeptide repeat protein [Undibacterium griseum]